MGQKIVLMMLVISAVCLFGAMKSCPRRPVARRVETGNLSLVGFVDLAGGDYRLAPTSPYNKAGADGKDIGCDFDALNPEWTKNR